MSQQLAKPKRQREENKRRASDNQRLGMHNEEWGDNATAFLRWMDEGKPGPNGTIEHDILKISIGEESVVVSLGDTVLLRSPTKDEEAGFDFYGSRPNSPSKANVVIARVERMWEEQAVETLHGAEEEKHRIKRLKVRARWFLNVSMTLLFRRTLGAWKWFYSDLVNLFRFSFGKISNKMRLLSGENTSEMSQKTGPTIFLLMTCYSVIKLTTTVRSFFFHWLRRAVHNEFLLTIFCCWSRRGNDLWSLLRTV